MVCSIRFNVRGYKPLIRVEGSRSHRSKTQMEGRKDEDTRKKGKMAEKRVCGINHYIQGQMIFQKLWVQVVWGPLILTQTENRLGMLEVLFT